MRYFIVSLFPLVFAVGQCVTWTNTDGMNTTARVVKITDRLIEVMIE